MKMLILKQLESMNSETLDKAILMYIALLSISIIVSIYFFIIKDSDKAVSYFALLMLMVFLINVGSGLKPQVKAQEEVAMRLQVAMEESIR